MPAFRFDAILRLRENERDAARALLAEALEALRQLESRRAEITAERQALIAGSASRRSGTISVDRLLADGRYERQLAADDAQTVSAMQKVEEELARRQSVLAEANAAVRQMEILRDKEKAALAEKQAKVEQDNLDEIAGRLAAGRNAGADSAAVPVARVRPMTGLERTK